MAEEISPTHRYLLAQYGPLLTVAHLAEIMHTSPNGLRMAIARKRQPLGVAFANAKRLLGRRIYFDARRVAEAIERDGTTATSAGVGPDNHSSSSNGDPSPPAAAHMTHT